MLLGLPALLGAGAIVWFARPASRGATAAAALGAVALVVAAGAALYAGPLADRFAETHVEPRSQIWPVVAQAAAAHAPIGAGAGAYETVYRAAEPLALLTAYTPPHADNDYLEIWLECGVPGALLVLAFLAWLAPSLVRAWRGPGADDLARAASVAIVLLLVHSAVDEPLRTMALSTLFGFLVGGGHAASAQTYRQPRPARVISAVRSMICRSSANEKFFT